MFVIPTKEESGLRVQDSSCVGMTSKNGLLIVIPTKEESGLRVQDSSFVGMTSKNGLLFVIPTKEESSLWVQDSSFVGMTKAAILLCFCVLPALSWWTYRVYSTRSGICGDFLS